MSSFLGHQKAFLQLSELWKANRLPHAMVFVGPEGVGKQLVARDIAKTILQTNDAIDRHPDFTLVEPEKSRIKIDTIREIKKSLIYSPLNGENRVVIFNDAHCMNTAAANALLKSLEEPPAGTYFILITHSMGWIPGTILSRSQKVRFSPLTPEELQQVLTIQNISAPKNILQWAQGSAARAIRLAKLQDDIPSLRSLFPSRECISFAQVHALVNKIVEEDAVTTFLQSMLAATHQVLTGPRKNKKYDFDLLNFADRILEIRQNLRQNINPKLHLTRLLMYFQEPKESRL